MASDGWTCRLSGRTWTRIGAQQSRWTDKKKEWMDMDMSEGGVDGRGQMALVHGQRWT